MDMPVQQGDETPKSAFGGNDGGRPELDAVIDEARSWLSDKQAQDGSWAFELEADATIPAEYIMLNHYLGEPNDAIEAKMGNYLRRIQGEHGGWPLFHDGDFNMSATVKAYYALKLIGDDPEAPHMGKARAAVLAGSIPPHASQPQRVSGKETQSNWQRWQRWEWSRPQQRVVSY